MYWLPKMNKHFSILCLLAMVGGTALKGQVVLTPQARDGLLDGLEATVSNVDEEAGEFNRLPSPFNPSEEPDVDVQVVERRPADERQQGERLPDELALRIVGDQFKPLGSLVMGSRALLQLAGGRTIQAGEQFNADIKGNTYAVEIAEVTSKGYVLRLGSAEVRKTFLTTTGATQ